MITQQKKAQSNYTDYRSVLIGSVHNIGAGGVESDKSVDLVLISDKRFDQYIRRTDRAVGIR
jgi:hypothetical protein